eukprot:3309539-Prymnesium_polylepis.1
MSAAANSAEICWGMRPQGSAPVVAHCITWAKLSRVNSDGHTIECTSAAGAVSTAAYSACKHRSDGAARRYRQ